MKVLTRALVVTTHLVLIALVSCEIEDEYSKPDMSEVLGKQLSTNLYYPIRLYWTTGDEVIAITSQDVTAFGIDKRTIRMATLPASEYGYFSAWQVENKIYLLSGQGVLSSMDIDTFKFTEAIVDSVSIYDTTSPFTNKHIAYSKIGGPDSQLSVFVYDLTTGIETYVAPGRPWLFSPDGKQLLFESGPSFIYDLNTKTITATGQFANYGAVTRWASEGIISFTQNYNTPTTVTVRNESAGQVIGEWVSLDGITIDKVSPTGNTFITRKTICGYPNVIGECPGYTKSVYSLVDVYKNTEQQLIIQLDSYPAPIGFSPDEKNFVYASNGHIYISENEN